MNPVRPEPVEGLSGIYGVHPAGEGEETRSCFDWAQHERVSSRPTDFFRFNDFQLTWLIQSGFGVSYVVSA
jgi:hypothetical protein